MFGLTHRDTYRLFFVFVFGKGRLLALPTITLKDKREPSDKETAGGRIGISERVHIDSFEIFYPAAFFTKKMKVLMDETIITRSASCRINFSNKTIF